ncbi:MAG: apolipoprotein N-acyltransferase [Deltaproteobacteria bacterium]
MTNSHWTRRAFCSRWRRLLAAASSGVMFGFSTPGFGLPLLGLVALVPLLILYEEILSIPQRRRNSFFNILGYSFVAGSISAVIGGYCITNSAHVYGHLPLPLAVLVTAVGYGLEVGLIFFFYFGCLLPFLPKHSWADLPVRILWILILEPHYPRLFEWSLGGFTYYKVPYIEQFADIIGSSGLSLLSVGCNLTFLLAWRFLKQKNDDWINVKFASILLITAHLLAGSYGKWRLLELQDVKSAAQIEVVSLQPNFSLAQLASNPDLAYSERSRNIESLLDDSRKALTKTQRQEKDLPRLLVWPESTFPAPIYKDASARELVSNFAKEERVNILLSTVDWEMQEDGSYRFFGISVLVNPDGEIAGRYNKIFLIPFGESIPGSSWFPSWAAWLREMIPNISEFEAGQEFTAMPIGDVKISAPICFDGFSPEIIQKMVLNGANLIVLSGNLAWFGKSNAADYLEMITRWRSLENRVPVVFATNSGYSSFWDATGQVLTKRMGLFEEGYLDAVIDLSTYNSWYREKSGWLIWIYNILIMLALGYLITNREKKTISQDGASGL